MEKLGSESIGKQSVGPSFSYRRAESSLSSTGIALHRRESCLGVILRAAHSNDQWAQWYKNIALALGSGQHRRLTLTPELPAVWEEGEHQLRSHTPQRSPASLQHTQLTDTDSLRAEPQAKCGELLQEAEEK